MKRLTFLANRARAAACLIVLLFQLPAIAQEGRLEEIQVHSKGLEGNLLGDSATRNVTVYLPHEYGTKPDKRYPVVYLLHGYSGRNTLWTGGGYVENLNLAAIADKLIASGQIQPMILAAPDCHNTYRGSWYTNSPVTGNWEDFVTKDLVQYIDSNYRTIPKRMSRGIAGHSMGGHGAIKIAMQHPDLFSVLYAMSPAWVVFQEVFKVPLAEPIVEAVQADERGDFSEIHWRGQACIALAAAAAPDAKCEPFFGRLPVDAGGNRITGIWEKWLDHDLATKMLTKYGDNLRGYTAVAIDCGSEEGLLPMNIIFSGALKEAGIPHTFEEFEGTHTNRVASQLEEKVLPLFSKTLQADKEAVAVPIQ